MYHLLDMGDRFCQAAERAAGVPQSRPEEVVFQNLHWGLELILKAFLHGRGWDDQRCLTEVRHELTKALAACEKEGLTDVDPRARALLASLSPYSSRHRVDEFVADGACGWTSEEAVKLMRELGDAVRRDLCLKVGS